MKIFCYCIIISILLINCDTSTETEVSIVNKSYHDLHIKFNVSERPMHGDRTGQYNDIELIKDTLFTFILNRFGPSEYRRPNDEVREIIFSDLNTREVIKILDNTKERVFKLTNSKSDWMGELNAAFLLEVTNELLQ